MRTITARCIDLWPRLKAPVWMTPVHRRPARSQAAGRAQRAEDPGDDLSRRRHASTIGPFEIEAIPVTHSIPEPVSLAITTPLGTVIHTGDWKTRPGARDRPDDRRGALPRARRRGRAGADLRFHQRACARANRRPKQAVGDGLRERHREGAGPRRRHHLLLQCRAHPLDRRGGARRRPRRCWCSAAR